MKKAITKTDIELHRVSKGLPGLPDTACEYIILDGTRAQLEGWEPWQTMKRNHPEYNCFYINLDETNGDPERYDIVNYATPQVDPYPPALRYEGASAGDTAIVRYNTKEGVMTDDIMFLSGNIEQNQSYYIIDVPNTL